MLRVNKNLIARINCVMKPQGEMLHKSRGPHMKQHFGEYYLAGAQGPICYCVHVRRLAKDCGVR